VYQIDAFNLKINKIVFYVFTRRKRREKKQWEHWN